MTRPRTLVLAPTLAGWLLLGIGFATAPAQALFSYLAAFAYTLSLALGALVLLMLGHAMRARWIVALRRIPEAIAATLPLFALLFLPIAVGMDRLYPWVSPGADLAHELGSKLGYLEPGFFLVRSALYLGVFVAIAEVLRWLTRRFERAFAEARPAPDTQRAVSAASFPLLGLCLTFAAFDWLMSLSPTWFSAVFGLLYFAGGFLGALALVALLGWALGPAPGVGLGVPQTHKLGKLVLTFVVFWAYLAYSQGFLIWIANKPIEITWYRIRATDGWGLLGLFLIVTQFALPFFLLLSYRLKRRPAALAAVGGWLLMTHYLEVYWMVLPALHPGAPAPHVLDLAALLAVGGSLFWLAMLRQAGRGWAAADLATLPAAAPGSPP